MSFPIELKAVDQTSTYYPSPQDQTIHLVCLDGEIVKFPYKYLKYCGSLFEQFDSGKVNYTKQMLDNFCKFLGIYSDTALENHSLDAIKQCFPSFDELIEFFEFCHYYDNQEIRRLILELTRTPEFLEGMEENFDFEKYNTPQQNFIYELLFYKKFYEKNYTCAALHIHRLIQDNGLDDLTVWFKQNSIKEEALPIIIETILNYANCSGFEKMKEASMEAAIQILKSLTEPVLKKALPIQPIIDPMEMPLVKKFSPDSSMPLSASFLTYFFSLFRIVNEISTLESATKLFEIFISPSFLMSEQEKKEFMSLKFYGAKYFKHTSSVIVTLMFQHLLPKMSESKDSLKNIWRDTILKIETPEEEIYDKSLTLQYRTDISKLYFGLDDIFKRISENSPLVVKLNTGYQNIRIIFWKNVNRY